MAQEQWSLVRLSHFQKVVVVAAVKPWKFEAQAVNGSNPSPNPTAVTLDPKRVRRDTVVQKFVLVWFDGVLESLFG